MFDDPAAMQAYLNSRELPCGASLSMTGSQCEVPVGAEACMPGNCKITYGCEAPELGSCSDSIGQPCLWGGDTIQCMNDAGGETCSYESTLVCCGAPNQRTWQTSC